MAGQSEYQRDCERATLDIVNEYYGDEAPSKGAPAAYPLFPDEDSADIPEAVPFQYVECELPEGTFLAILTPFEVHGGPGRKFKAVAE
jgi:hypothetical protein